MAIITQYVMLLVALLALIFLETEIWTMLILKHAPKTQQCITEIVEDVLAIQDAKQDQEQGLALTKMPIPVHGLTTKKMMVSEI